MKAKPDAAGARRTSPPTSAGGWPSWWPTVVLVAATIAVYANSFGGVFQFDDRVNIHDQPAVHHLWPPDWLHTSRPLTDLTLAINWSAGGDRPFGYHLGNVAIHLVAGLLLFGCVRRSAVRLLPDGAIPRFACGVALLWMLHPLQTQSVTYIIQRAESLAAMLTLLTLYAAIRTLSAATARRRRGWVMLALVACALGQGAKPVAVTAPLLIVLYDRALWFASFRIAWRMRWPLYVGLMATWLVTYALDVVSGILDTSGGPTATVGLAVAHASPWTYLCTQAGVIVHYLRLVLWPDALVLDYGWPLARGVGDVWRAGLAVLALLVGACAAWRRRPWLSFCILWFFIILAPTSTIVPIVDPAFEHRMYLPLAGLVVGALAGARALLLRLAGRRAVGSPAVVLIGALALAAVAAGWASRTVVRNSDYHDPIRLWRRNVQDRPGNPRAHNNLCQALNAAGDNSAAMAACDEALRLTPNYADAWNNRANVLLGLNRPQEAADACARALSLRDGFVDAHVTCGYALILLGRLDEAIAHERAALAHQPGNLQALNNLGNALAQRGDTDEARAVFNRALALAPDRADTHNNLAWLLAAQGDLPGAAAHFEQAVAADPALLTAHFNLGETYLRMGREAEARATWTRALRLADERGAAQEAAMFRRRLGEINSR